MAEACSKPSDRALQDAVIRYLADANLRRTAPPALPLSAQQAERAGRFARFLARRYYRDRLARSFRYSRRFGAAAEAIVETSAFDAFLEECILGSLASAEKVGNLAVDHLSAAPAPGPWWGDLLGYERAFFLQAATMESAPAGEFLQPARSACCRRFAWNMPDLLSRLKSGESIAGDLRAEVTLLFSRTPLGRIYVVEADEATAAIFHAASQGCSPAQIAQALSLPAASVQQTLNALASIGALVTSSE